MENLRGPQRNTEVVVQNRDDQGVHEPSPEGDNQDQSTAVVIVLLCIWVERLKIGRFEKASRGDHIKWTDTGARLASGASAW